MLIFVRGAILLVALIGPVAHAIAGGAIEECNADDDALKLRGCAILIEDGNQSADTRAIAYSRRSDAHLARGDLDQVISDLTEARRLEPKFTEHSARLSDAYRLRGEVRINAGELDRGIGDLSEALAASPENHRALLSRGQAFLAQRDRDRALADFSAGSRLDPGNADYKAAATAVYAERGREHLAQSRFDRAIADLDEAIRLDERNTALLMDRAAAHRGRKDISGAIADYSAALRIDPALATAYLQRAEVEYRRGNYRVVISDCSEVLTRNDKSYPALMLRGLANENIDQHEEAVRDYRAALALAPADQQAATSLERATRTATTTAALARLGTGVEPHKAETQSRAPSENTALSPPSPNKQKTRTSIASTPPTKKSCWTFADCAEKCQKLYGYQGVSRPRHCIDYTCSKYPKSC